MCRFMVRKFDGQKFLRSELLAGSVIPNPLGMFPPQVYTYWLVEDGGNGFLFDPNAPEDISATLQRYFELSRQQRETMSEASRQRAQELLSPAQMVKHYIELIEK